MWSKLRQKSCPARVRQPNSTQLRTQHNGWNDSCWAGLPLAEVRCLGTAHRIELLGDQKDSGRPESGFEGSSISQRLRHHQSMPLNPQCPQPDCMNLMQNLSI